MSKPAHLFVACDGDLFDTRAPNWSAKPLRIGYQISCNVITTPAHFKATLRAGPYAWPGGYQLYLLTTDGAALCYKCAHKEAHQIIPSIAGNARDGWNVCGCAINYEDNELRCDHCSKTIPASYGDI